MKKNQIFILELIIGIIIGAAITLILAATRFTPVGNDIFGHLYKAEVLYDNIRQFNLYPLYTTEWYNGIQLFRYWPIFTYYVLAFINFATRDIFSAYYVFAGLSFFMAYMGFVMIGRREGKNAVFAIIGILYWFLPDNLRVFFAEGNLSRVMIYALLPLFFYFYTNLLEHKKNFIVTSLLAALITATHFMLAAMCAVIFVIYGFFKGMKHRTQFYGLYVLAAGILIAGILLLPGLSGGLVTDSSSAAIDTIEDWSQPLYYSISPFNRLATDRSCAFGIGVLVMAVLGIFIAKKNREEKSGMVVGLIFFILSDSVFTTVFKQLPLSQVFWMTRFVQMSYILILYDFGRMTLAPYKRYAVIGVTVLDILPSMPFFTMKSDLSYQENEYLLREACNLTQNRLGLVDESIFGSYPAYYALKRNVPYTQGWAIQGASTSGNIVSVTESVQRGHYGYAFHQLLQLGSDTVLIKKSFVKDFDGLIKAAGDYGYELVSETSEVYLFDLADVTGNFGVTSGYNSLAIGDSSIFMSYIYPGFEQSDTEFLTDYKVEELLGYDKIYLSNFKYDDLAHAEQMVQELSDAGVKVYIDCTHMPINVMAISEFLGVESRFISISDFDALKYGDCQVEIDMPYEWYSAYLVPVEDNNFTEYTYPFGTQIIDYLIEKDNITFVGFNLVYMYYENENEELLKFLDNIFDITEEDRIVREKIIPIRLQFDKNRIMIETDERVNTTIAFQDNFKSEQEIYSENNMLVAGEGITVIHIYYKHLLLGFLCSVAGYAFMLAVYWKIELRTGGKS